MMSGSMASLMSPVLRRCAVPAIRRADRTVTGWTASGSYEVTSRLSAGRRPASRHVNAMTRGQATWGSDSPNDVDNLTVNLVGYKACVIVRQYGPELHAAIWTHVSCRHTRKASARACRY